MTSEQYQLLLAELARVAGIADSSSLLKQGLVKIGDLDAKLVHNPDYDENLMQVRMLLGSLDRVAEEQRHTVAMAMLQSNYIYGYAGECVFSVLPDSKDVVLTLRQRLHPALTAQELWQELSEAARHGAQMWEEIDAARAVIA